MKGADVGYTIFEKKQTRIGTPAVTVLTNARIALNASVTKLFNKMAVENILLLWDKDRTSMAIKPISKKDARAYKITYGKSLGGSSFSAKSFFDSVGYDYSEKRSMPAMWNEEEAILEVALPSEHIADARQARLLPMEARKSVTA
jgi:hypothetical protein